MVFPKAVKLPEVPPPMATAFKPPVIADVAPLIVLAPAPPPTWTELYAPFRRAFIEVTLAVSV